MANVNVVSHLISNARMKKETFNFFLLFTKTGGKKRTENYHKVLVVPEA